MIYKLISILNNNMSTTIDISQFIGWKNNDIFDVLLKLSSPEIKTIVLDLSQKYFLARQNGQAYSYSTTKRGSKYITSIHTIKAEDLHAYYDKHIDKKHRPAIINSISDDSSIDYVLFSLWDIVKVINEDHNINLHLIVVNNDLFLYTGDIIIKKTSVYEDSSDFSSIEYKTDIPNIFNEIKSLPSVITQFNAINKKDYYYDDYPEYPQSCGPYGLHNDPCTCACSCAHGSY